MSDSMQFTHHRNLFVDPTPNAVINQRLLRGMVELFQHTDLSDTEKETLLRLLAFIGVKLAAAWQHKDAYAQEEERLAAEAKAAPPPKEPISTEYLISQDLFLELDEFLVQVKSSLDHLVKIPVPILGKWPLRTFGDKGADVAKALLNNMPKAHMKAAPGLKKMLVDDHQDWLAAAIAVRDKMNHYLDGGVSLEEFSIYVTRSPEGVTVHTPMWSKSQSVREALDVIYANLFRLIEQFLGAFIGLRRHTAYGFLYQARPLDSVEPAWKAVLDPELGRALAGIPKADA